MLILLEGSTGRKCQVLKKVGITFLWGPSYDGSLGPRDAQRNAFAWGQNAEIDA